MTTTRVKICCIASIAEAQIAVDAGASALGLVGPMPSGPGVIDVKTAARVARSRPPGVSAFWLTSSVKPADIATEMEQVGADVVQLVRHLEPEPHLAIRKLLPSAARLVQVVHVEDESSVEYALRASQHVDALLLDSGRPSQAELGGTGRTHDWSLSREIVERSEVPVWLAGGLNPENVADAVESVRPFGLDVCSGLRRDGALDAELVAEFFANLADR